MREAIPHMDEITCAAQPCARRLARCFAAALFITVAVPMGSAEATPPTRPAALKQAVDGGAEVVLRALGLLGVRYRYGGNTPDTGLDCSGLVKLVFQDTVGMVLPRRSDDMSRYGQSVAFTDLQPGDLVYFNTMRLPFSHVGIYIGERRFVHAPSSGGVVRIESLDLDYWTRRFDGARRLLDAPAAPMEALAFEALPRAAEQENPALNSAAPDRYPSGN